MCSRIFESNKILNLWNAESKFVNRSIKQFDHESKHLWIFFIFLYRSSPLPCDVTYKFVSHTIIIHFGFLNLISNKLILSVNYHSIFILIIPQPKFRSNLVYIHSNSYIYISYIPQFDRGIRPPWRRFISIFLRLQQRRRRCYFIATNLIRKTTRVNPYSTCSGRFSFNQL